MKKAYLKPNTGILILDSFQMLASSPQLDVKNPDSTGGSIDAGNSWSNERAWGNNLWDTPDEEK